MSHGVVIPSQQKHASLGDMGSLFLLLPGQKKRGGDDNLEIKYRKFASLLPSYKNEAGKQP